MMTFAELGYDPRPEVSFWRGTHIPPVDRPLKKTPRRWEIAGRVWWQGPPWTVLRNASCYLWQVMDEGRSEDLWFTLDDVPEELWHHALAQARPGLLSRGSYVLWSLYFGRMGLHDGCDWPTDAHRRDYRPMAHWTRDRIYRHVQELRRKVDAGAMPGNRPVLRGRVS